MARYLLVNPWIYDFAAYDFWAKPLGLLYLASLLRREDHTVFFFDCTDQENPYSKLPRPKRRKDKRAHFHKEVVEKPKPLKDIPLRYKRYGVEEEAFRSFLEDIDPPDFVFITTRMTYYYPGALKVIDVVREFFSRVKILVGGIYPRLCMDHAKKTLGDAAYPGGFEIVKRVSFKELPPPSFDLYHKLHYAVYMLSVGCPFKCTYCATPILFPNREEKDPKMAFEELSWIVDTCGVKDIAFYDDALLANRKLFKDFLRLVLGRYPDITFHNPNGVHARFLDREVAELMALCFSKVFLSLETVSRHGERLHEKVKREDFERALDVLFNAGLSRDRIGVYLLVGFPGQSFEEAKEDVDYVKSFGIRPSLAEFSPVPGTPLFQEAKRLSRYPLDEPLFHNNTLFPMESPRFTREQLNWLKIYARS